MAKNLNNAYGLQNPLQNVFPVPIQSQRAPTFSDVGYPIGQVWVDLPVAGAYMLMQVSGGLATWTPIGGGTIDVDTLTPDIGLPVTPVAGTIALTGLPAPGGIKGMRSYNGGAATLQFSNLRDISAYIVGTDFNTSQYQSINSAIVQAVADGASAGFPAIVYVTAGEYVEDIVLAPWVDVVSIGGIARVTGNHTAVTSNMGDRFAMIDISLQSPVFPLGPVFSIQGMHQCDVKFQNVLFNGISGTCLENINTNTSSTIQGFNIVLQAASGVKALDINHGVTSLFDSFITKTDTKSEIAGDSIVTFVGGNLVDAFNVSGTAIGIVVNSFISSGTDECFTVAAGSSATCLNTTLSSIAVSGFYATGAGAFIYNSLTPIGSASVIDGALSTTNFQLHLGNLSFDGGVTSIVNDGELIIGNSFTGVPTISTLTAGPGIGIVNAPGSVTISAAGAGMLWTVVNAPTTAADDNGYFTTGGVTVTLPLVSNVGDTFAVYDSDGMGWQVNQNALQTIQLGNLTTTAGLPGGLVNTAIGDCVMLVCSVANLSWNVISSEGNIVVN